MSNLVISDWYGGLKRHILDLETGDVTTMHIKDKERCLGFGQYRKIGLWKRTKVFIAIYADGKSLILRIGNQIFTVSNDEITVIRKRIAPFVRHFEIKDQDQVVLSMNYFAPFWDEEDPKSWDAEFLTYIENTINDKRMIPRTIEVWSDVNLGGDNKS